MKHIVPVVEYECVLSHRITYLSIHLQVVGEEKRPGTEASQLSHGSIKVTSIMVAAEMEYSELESDVKESILTELLVKSAITHAIRKQKVMCQR